jgi:hypothetical protein
MAFNGYRNSNAGHSLNSGYTQKSMKTKAEIEDQFTCGVCANIIENAYRPNACTHA